MKLLHSAGAKMRLLVVCALCLAVQAKAQTTTVTASSLKMGGIPIATGTVTITPTDGSGNPIPFTSGDGSMNGPEGFSAPITAGALGSGFNVPDQAQGTALTPNTSLFYSVNVLNTVTKQSYTFVLPPSTITGPFFALDHYAPTQIAAALAGSAVGTALPYAGRCSGTAHFVLYSGSTITGTYDCVNGYLRQDPAGSGSGVAPTITIGTVTQGPAAASLTGGNGAYTLNLTLPQGAAGANGTPGTNGTNGTNGATPSFSIGSVATGAAGSQASVTLTGTQTAPVLNFTIPQGAAGTGGSGSSIALKVNGTANGSQSVLNLKAGSNVTLSDDGAGGITITSVLPTDPTFNSVTVGGSGAGVQNFVQGAAPSTLPANTIQEYAPTSVTAYQVIKPGAVAASTSGNALALYTVSGQTMTARWADGCSTFICITASTVNISGNATFAGGKIRATAVGGGYNSFSVSGSDADGSRMGFVGGAPGDPNLYWDTVTGGAHNFRLGTSIVFTIGNNGTSGTGNVVNTTLPLTATSLSTNQASSTGTTCTIGGYVTLTIDGTARKVAYCN